MAFTNFGEQFAAKTLRKFYQSAITPAITNTNYEGDIKKAGDRVNILSFLSDITLSDYTAGSDMSVESLVDAEDTLLVEKRKYYNFPIDRLEDLFTYANDVDDTLVENANKVLERTIDAYVLNLAGDARAGNWVGINLRVVGSSSDTEASVATTATGGTITISTADATSEGQATVENPVDGGSYLAGFTSADVGKPIRLTSGASWATEWYKISAVTNTSTVTVVNWDGALSGSDIPNGDILRGLAGGPDYLGAGVTNGDGKPTTEAGWGWELQAAAATTLTESSVYDAIVEVAQALDKNEIPDTDRHLTGPANLIAMLRRASELQPAIAIAYDGVVLNGRVARVAGFDVHMAAGARVSSRAGHATSSGQGSDIVLTAGTSGFQMLGNHISFCTFAYKWAESRVVDAEDQFAKKYQGLHLFGAKVPALRRKAGSVLFGTF